MCALGGAGVKWPVEKVNPELHWRVLPAESTVADKTGGEVIATAESHRFALVVVRLSARLNTVPRVVLRSRRRVWCPSVQRQLLLATTRKLAAFGSQQTQALGAGERDILGPGVQSALPDPATRGLDLASRGRAMAHWVVGGAPEACHHFRSSRNANSAFGTSAWPWPKAA